jgi:uncharacterized protein (DUF885 family)
MMIKGEERGQRDRFDFDAWLESFFVHLFLRRPVDATFAGFHDYSHLLPDVSPEGLSATRDEINRLLSGLKCIGYENLDRYRKIDFDLARGFLEIQAWERTEGGYFDHNPISYTSEAAFALMSLFLSDTRPMPERAESFNARLSALPEFFLNAKSNLLSSPPLWIDRAVDECVGALAFLKNGVPILKDQESLIADEALLGSAIGAFEDFMSFLERDLRSRSGGSYSCGEKAFRNIVRNAHGMDMDPFDYADHAEAIIASLEIELAEECRALGLASPEEALVRLAEDRPGQASYLGEYARLWEELRLFNQRENIVTWPDFPLEYKAIPEWARDAQPHLYFLYYRCPPRYARPDTYRYNVTPIGEGLPGEKQEALLKANNSYVIKTNHVLHHGGIGHHVQNWHALRSRSKIGQISCTDGASRLLMLCSGTLCEGWACYITKAAGEMGFLSPLEKFAEKASHRRMAARAVVDVRLHGGVYSLEDAIRFYREKAKMSESFARSEAVKNSLFPGGAIMYLYGVEGIESLKGHVSRAKGETFSLKAFHDEFLSYGGIPVDRISKEMKAERT